MAILHPRFGASNGNEMLLTADGEQTLPALRAGL